jgi:hypothetical protein
MRPANTTLALVVTALTGIATIAKVMKYCPVAGTVYLYRVVSHTGVELPLGFVVKLYGIAVNARFDSEGG